MDFQKVQLSPEELGKCLKSIWQVNILLKSIFPPPPPENGGGRGGGDHEVPAKLTVCYVISSANRFCCYKST